MTQFKLFGREPALWLGLISSLVMFAGAFGLNLTADQQALINAASAALFGLLTAWFIAKDGLTAAILGFVQAVLALAVGFGLNLPSDKQTIIMVVVSALTSMFVRTQATAPVSKEGTKVAPQSLT